ncbi:MAG: transposase [bacterium]
MLKACKINKQEVIKAIEEGDIDNGDIAFSNFIDDIITKMNQMGLTNLFDNVFIDKRDENSTIPLNIIFTLSAAAKMKIMTSLTDIPFAIMDSDTLAELGWNFYDTDYDLETGLISNGAIRGLLEHYIAQEFVDFYNNYTKHSLENLDHIPSIHILDCTKIDVNVDNENYENSTVIKDDGELRRGYKLASLRGLLDSSGVIEQIEMGTMKTHDLTLSKNILYNSPALHPGDIVIEDRGFISRGVLNYLKIERKVDTYIPVKKNMELYEEAIKLALEKESDINKWNKHPNRKRKNQVIATVKNVGSFWQSNNPEDDVELNASVVYDKKDDEYYVFVSTDITATGRQIIKTYELRPEIEEDFRQLKDFWKMEEFKSTKYTHIVFHIVMLLIGYFYYQLYKNTDEGSKYARMSLPVILKRYNPKKKAKKVIIYAGKYFGMFGFSEFLEIYASCSKKVREKLKEVLDMI